VLPQRSKSATAFRSRSCRRRAPSPSTTRFGAGGQPGANVFTVLLNDFNFDNQTGGANLNITAVSDPPTARPPSRRRHDDHLHARSGFLRSGYVHVHVVDTTNAGDGPSTATVTVNVTGVNDQPSFTASESAHGERGRRTAITTGMGSFRPGAERVRPSRLAVSRQQRQQSRLVRRTAPSVANNGTLTYTLRSGCFGTSTLPSGSRTTAARPTVGSIPPNRRRLPSPSLSVNDPPTFTAADPPAVNEGPGRSDVRRLGHQFQPGPPTNPGRIWSATPSATSATRACSPCCRRSPTTVR
jgi:hypothetical protein